MIAGVGACPCLVMEDPAHAMPPSLQGKIFAMQLDRAGTPTVHFVAEPYDLLFSRNAAGQNKWALRQKTNGGYLTMLTSAPMADAWLVDGALRPRKDVFFYNPQGAQVAVQWRGHLPTAAAAAEVIDVDATQPVLQQIFAALQTQTQSQKAALDESKATGLLMRLGRKVFLILVTARVSLTSGIILVLWPSREPERRMIPILASCSSSS